MMVIFFNLTKGEINFIYCGRPIVITERIKMRKQSFKEYNQNQIMLFPPNLSDMIEEKHLVRLVNEVIDKLDIKEIIRKYSGGGCSSYNPKMLLKILIYAYLNNTYSSRKIAEALKQNVHFLTLNPTELFQGEFA